MASHAPVIGITPDVNEDRVFLTHGYAEAVNRAGGVALILPPLVEQVEACLALCDGFVLSGGDDPWMEPFGVATHPKAKPVNLVRQEFETALLRRLENRPALGICLGMQLMALVSGGSLNQHLPDNVATHADHWGKKPHPVSGSLGSGSPLSNHRQAVEDPGRLEVIATAPDGVIEAVRDPSKPFHLGVQWHPERSGEGPLGDGLFLQLIAACRAQ